MRRIAEGEVVLLDADDVREVGGELELQAEGHRLAGLVVDREMILHAVADEAPAHDGERVLGEAPGQRVPRVERGGEVFDPARRRGAAAAHR